MRVDIDKTELPFLTPNADTNQILSANSMIIENRTEAAYLLFVVQTLLFPILLYHDNKHPFTVARNGMLSFNKEI